MTKHLLFSPDYAPVTGGIANFLKQRIANSNGIDLAVLTRKSPGWQRYDADSGVKTSRYTVPFNGVPVAGRIFQFLWGLQAVTARALGGRVQVIESGTALPGSFYGWLLKGFCPVKLITFAHGNDILRPRKHRLTDWMLRKGLGASDLVVANSTFTAGLLLEMGVESERITVINPAAEISMFSPDAGGDVVRGRYGLEGRTVLLIVSRLYDGRKGFDTLFESVRQLRNSRPDISLLVVGTGPAREDLERSARELGIADRVVFAGYVEDKELPAYYCAADIFVMVSEFDRSSGDVEGYGIVYDEAHACARPCIAADAGGAPDAVTRGLDGMLVPPGDADALSAAITRLADDPQLAKQYGRNGRKRILQKKYAWQVLNELGNEREKRGEHTCQS